MKEKDQYVHTIETLKKKRDEIIYEIEENDVSIPYNDYISAMLEKLDPVEARRVAEIEQNTINLYKTSKPKEEAIKPISASKKIVIGFFVASVAMLNIIVNNRFSTIAGWGNKFFSILQWEEGRHATVVSSVELGEKRYPDFGKIPNQYRKLVWAYEHKDIPLQEIEIFTSNSFVDITSFYKSATDEESFSIGLSISTNDTYIFSNNFYDKEEYRNIQVEDTTMYIYRLEDEDGEQFSIEFIIENIQYRVSGNLSLSELQGIALEYLHFIQT